MNLKWISLILLLILSSFALRAAAQTINATDCSESAVSSALSSISASGATVAVPSGNCTWTAPLNITTAFSFTLAGQSAVATTNSQGNPATFTDSTLITDGQSGSGGNSPLITIALSGSSSQVVRVTGLSIAGGNVVYNGEIVLSGSTGQARVDHSHFIDIDDLAIAMYEPMTGVVDHSLFDVPNGDVYNGIRVYNQVGDGYGDTPWTVGPGFGTNAFIFFENNTFNNGFMNDCQWGGAYVARYNTFNVLAPNQNIGIQSHSTGSQSRGRGCRAWEVYENTAGSGGGSIVSSLGFQTSGTGLWWGNTVSNTSHDLALNEDRDNSSEFGETATPNGWGYCGTAQTGTASGFDGNTTASGYPCLDQIGRGQGDSLSGNWPDVQDDASPGVHTGVWPHQVLQPVYIWMETFSGTSSLVTANSPENNIVANRDYYAPASPFNGTSGTGYGLHSAIPSTCTPLVSYWATDTNTLYQCTSTNTWSVYYTPYTYPHPLTGSSTATAPAAPVSLKAVAQ
jgi:hypothetical protein